MDVNRILEQLKQLLIQHREEEAEAFLLEKLGQAARLGDRGNASFDGGSRT